MLGIQTSRRSDRPNTEKKELHSIYLSLRVKKGCPRHRDELIYKYDPKRRKHPE
jgi:hypothetical protein